MRCEALAHFRLCNFDVGHRGLLAQALRHLDTWPNPIGVLSKAAAQLDEWRDLCEVSAADLAVEVAPEVANQLAADAAGLEPAANAQRPIAEAGASRR